MAEIQFSQKHGNQKAQNSSTKLVHDKVSHTSIVSETSDVLGVLQRANLTFLTKDQPRVISEQTCGSRRFTISELKAIFGHKTITCHENNSVP